MRLFRYVAAILMLSLLPISTTQATENTSIDPYFWAEIPEGASWCHVYPISFHVSNTETLRPIPVYHWNADTNILRSYYNQNILNLGYDRFGTQVGGYTYLSWQDPSNLPSHEYLRSWRLGGTLAVGFSESPNQHETAPWSINGTLEHHDEVHLYSNSLSPIRYETLDSYIATKAPLTLPLYDLGIYNGLDSSVRIATFAKVRVLSYNRNQIEFIYLDTPNTYSCFDSSSRDTVGQTTTVQAFLPDLHAYDFDPNYEYLHTWNWGDGSPVEQVPTQPLSQSSHLYAQPGLYNVELRSSLMFGTYATNMVSNTGQVLIEPALKPLLTSSSTDKLGETTTVSVTLRQELQPWTQSRPVEVEIQWGDGSPSTVIPASVYNQATVTAAHQYQQAGNYTVKVAVTDNNGFVTTETTEVVIASAPIVRLYHSVPSYDLFLQKFKVDFWGEVYGGQGPFTYHWNFGDGITSTQQNPIHYYATAGTYSVTLNVTDGTGLVTTVTTSLMVQLPPKGTPPPPSDPTR